MRKFILLWIIALVLGWPARAADPIQLDLGFMKLVLPFQSVETEYLYDLKFQKNMFGLATPFLTDKSGQRRLVIGAAAEEGESKFTSYLGGDTEVSEKYFGERFNLGCWVGLDFSLPGDVKDKLRGGLKASILLW